MANTQKPKAMITDEIKKQFEVERERTAPHPMNWRSGFDKGAEFGYNLSQQRIRELEKENGRLKELIDIK